ncbi:MAG TPA: TolC family protein [Candidatus Eisenbacteria bacterium]|jgi:outer membrane protein TolC
MIEGPKPLRAQAALVTGVIVIWVALMPQARAAAQTVADQVGPPPVAARDSVPAVGPAAASTGVGALGGERWSLARVVAAALEGNVDARAAHARTVQARGSALRAWSGILPSVTGQLIYNHIVPDKQSSLTVIDSISFLTKRRQLQTAEAGVQSNLFSVPAWSEKRRQSLLRRGAEESEAEARNGVVYAVKQQYFALVKAERLAEVARESERLARDEETRAEALFEVGTVARGDVLKARARRATTQLDRIRAENQIEIQRSKLKQIIGLKPGTALEIDPTLGEGVALPDSGESIRTALSSRPELSRASAVERAARSGLFGARAERLPKVVGDLAVDRSKISDRVEVSGFGDLDFERYATEWQGTVRLTLPFFDGFALEGGTKSAKGALLEAEAQRRQREVDVAVEVQQAWLSMREAVQRIDVAKEGVASAEEDYSFSKGRYDLGAGTFLDLLNAQVNLAQAKQSYVEALADAHVAEAALEQAVGSRRY